MGEKKARAVRQQAAAARRRRLLLCSPLLAAGAACAVYVAQRAYREGYPLTQRCPPETDRFHDHCAVDRRQHYLIGIDWSCLGAQRAAAMARALDLDSPRPRGVGKVPSWLTEPNAAAVRGAPCILSLEPDLACRHCVPTPRLSTPSEKAASGGGEADGAGGVTSESPSHRAH